MTKLEQMSIEELWKLFPIFLTDHQDCWAAWFAEEKAQLEKILPPDLRLAICHVGSTAVPGIWAKPIVDVLILVPDRAAMCEAQQRLSSAGYVCMSENSGRISLNKGYTEEGFAERVFHIHLRLPGDTDELYFRNYLRHHPETAREYEALKLRLWRQYEYDRDAYTEAKTEFVLRCTEMAKREMREHAGCV